MSQFLKQKYAPTNFSSFSIANAIREIKLLEPNAQVFYKKDGSIYKTKYKPAKRLKTSNILYIRK